MMARYSTIIGDVIALGPTSIQVFEEDKTPKPTGLLDQHGHKIVRHPDTVPMGFHRQEGAKT